MEQTLRRVVVTGLGPSPPWATPWRRCGPNLKVWRPRHRPPITLFDTTDYKTKIGAEVKNFDPRAYMDKTDVLRSDAYAQYGVAAACQAVEESGVIGTLPPGAGGGVLWLRHRRHPHLPRGAQQAPGPGTQADLPYFIPMLIGNMARKHDRHPLQLPGGCPAGGHRLRHRHQRHRRGHAGHPPRLCRRGDHRRLRAAISECGVAGFVNMQALSTSEDPEAACLPFDKRRGGFVIGEGGAALVLEEYEHAVARGAKIYGEVVGYGATCDAFHITAPGPDGTCGARAIQLALKRLAAGGDRVHQRPRHRCPP